MAESVYKVVELVGTSSESWEQAAAAAVERAARSLRDLRIAEVAALDMDIKNGKIAAYRAKVKVSFKFEGGDQSAHDLAGSPARRRQRRYISTLMVSQTSIEPPELSIGQPLAFSAASSILEASIKL